MHHLNNNNNEHVLGGTITITHFHMTTKQRKLVFTSNYEKTMHSRIQQLVYLYLDFNQIHRHNWSTMFIDFFAWIGWAYDLKSIPWNVVKDRVKRTGDGSHGKYSSSNKSEDEEDAPVKQVWGWGDVDMTEDDYKITEIYKPVPNPAG